MIEISQSAVNLILFSIFGILSFFQIKILNKSASDHRGHLFIINETKKSWSLPSHPNSIVNKSSWGGYPILLHYLIGKLPDFLRPFFSNYIGLLFSLLTPLTVLFFFDYFDNTFVVFLLLFAPHNFDVSNASNYGFSTRSIGQFFFILTLCLFLQNSQIDINQDLDIFLFMVISIFFLLSFNVFALQSLIFVSLISCFFGYFLPLIVLFTSSLVFSIVFRKYGYAYLKSTFKYWNTYRTHLAKTSILIDYPSFWITPFKKLPSLIENKDIKGIYNLFFRNVLFLSLVFNPIPWFTFFNPYLLDFTEPYVVIFLSMFFAFFITSVKFGRFWGESSRYLEMLTPFSIIYSFTFFDEYAEIIVIYFIFLIALLIFVSYFLSLRLHNKENIFGVFEEEIKVTKSENILLFSNNHHASKYFLTNPWNFVLIWSFEEEIVQVKSPVVFSEFPRIKFKYFMKIIDEYKPNILLVEKLDDVNDDDILNRGYSPIKNIHGYTLYKT